MIPVATRAGAHPYGDSAFGVLSRVVHAAKADPFSPVTVLVEHGGLALAVRRRLAGEPPGVVHLRCTTWTRLAAELAAGWLASERRTVASAAVELEAVRSALSELTPPSLTGALDQPGTLRALARTCRELATVPDAALEALASQGTRAADVTGVVRRVRCALSGCVGASELLGAAATEVRRSPARAAELCGAVAVYLPRRVGTPEIELAEALGECTEVEVIVGTTGDDASDRRSHELVALLSVRSAPVAAPARPFRPARALALPTVALPTVVRPTVVRSAPSADAEVLLALRHLMGRNEEGVPLERMALLHSGVPPYPQLVHDVLAGARVPAHGGRVRQLSSSVAGRALSGALALADHDWRRDDLSTWIASAPLVHDGHLVPSAEWDTLSAEAGIVSGLDQWRERLRALAVARRADAQLEDLRDDGEGDVASDGERDGDRTSSHRARRLQLDARRCDELRAFLDAISQRLEQTPRTWAGWGEWANRLLTDLLGTAARRAGWPPDEVVAFDAVAGALGRIGALDWLGGAAPGSADFRAALAAELDAPAPETARFGHGLFVGRVEGAVGLDLDVVCVVGMVDGAFPPRRGDDVLLPDRERERAGAAVPLRRADPAEARHDFFAALACARERILSYSRYDQRHGRELRPARLLLDSLEALAGDGRRLAAAELRSGPPPSIEEGRFQFVASFADAVRDGARTGAPVTEADWRLRSLARWVTAGNRVSDHFLVRVDPALAGAVEVRASRRSARFTRFDGLVERVPVPSPASGKVQSATGLESFARCPRRYFFSHLLRVTARELPETVLQISPAERGVIVHRVLERLVGAEIDRRASGGGDDEDAVTRQTRMLALAAEEFGGAQSRGVTGHPALWALERSRMTSDLGEHLRVDTEYRTATGALPVAVELVFGPPSGADVAVETSAGAVRFRGRIDRVDELAGGELAVVDYKSGKPFSTKDVGDPLSGGERLQLPVYALAAKAAYGEDREVRAGYWFVGAPTPPEWLTLDGSVHDRLAEVVGALSEGIEAGRFPARPGPEGWSSHGDNCRFCPYDGMCPPDRGASWRRKRADPALAGYVSLVGETGDT